MINTVVNMKQEQILKLNLDIKDLHILVYYFRLEKNLLINKKTKKFKNDIYVSINFDKLIECLPILKLKKESLQKRFMKYSKLGILKTYIQKLKGRGTNVFYRATELFFSLFDFASRKKHQEKNKIENKKINELENIPKKKSSYDKKKNSFALYINKNNITYIREFLKSFNFKDFMIKHFMNDKSFLITILRFIKKDKEKLKRVLNYCSKNNLRTAFIIKALNSKDDLLNTKRISKTHIRSSHSVKNIIKSAKNNELIYSQMRNQTKDIKAEFLKSFNVENYDNLPQFAKKIFDKSFKVGVVNA